MRRANIELHIEELVLHGFAPGDRHRIGDAVERELSRLFDERGVPTNFMNNFESPRLDAGSFNFAPTSTAETIGAEVARALYGGFGL
jgi:hypothetical protein